MNTLPKLLESESTIRFQDCDPYGHLYNAKYIDYFMNAREDQVLEAYDLDIYKMGSTHGVGWVVAQNEIAYLQPAGLMERVKITTKIINLEPRGMTVEFQMLNPKTDRLKAFLWSRFVHFDLRLRKSIEHSAELMGRFKEVVYPIEERTFEERVKRLRSQVTPR